MTLTQRIHKDDGTCHDACWRRAVREFEAARLPEWRRRRLASADKAGPVGRRLAVVDTTGLVG